MSPFLLVIVVIVLLMTKRLAELYAGGEYACPSCGARSQKRHSPDCPWDRTH
jgi:hypothetical protein